MWVQRERVWRTAIANHDRVLRALQEVPGIQLKIEGLHDVPIRVLTVRHVGCPTSAVQLQTHML